MNALLFTNFHKHIKSNKISGQQFLDVDSLIKKNATEFRENEDHEYFIKCMFFNPNFNAQLIV